MFLCFRTLYEDEAVCKQVTFKSLSVGSPDTDTVFLFSLAGLES